jgi:hypothetical protein
VVMATVVTTVATTILVGQVGVAVVMARAGAGRCTAKSCFHRRLALVIGSVRAAVTTAMPHETLASVARGNGRRIPTRLLAGREMEASRVQEKVKGEATCSAARTSNVCSRTPASSGRGTSSRHDQSVVVMMREVRPMEVIAPRLATPSEAVALGTRTATTRSLPIRTRPGVGGAHAAPAPMARGAPPAGSAGSDRRPHQAHQARSRVAESGRNGVAVDRRRAPATGAGDAPVVRPHPTALSAARARTLEASTVSARRRTRLAGLQSKGSTRERKGGRASSRGLGRRWRGPRGTSQRDPKLGNAEAAAAELGPPTRLVAVRLARAGLNQRVSRATATKAAMGRRR